MKKIPYQPILLFDGICNLCNSCVNFVIKQDKKQKFKFASIQSDVAKEILLQFESYNSNTESIYLIYNNKLYSKSSAVLYSCKIIGGFCSIWTFFFILPKSIRDWMYDIIAKNRYNWFGKREHCMVPNPEIKDRFLF